MTKFLTPLLLCVVLAVALVAAEPPRRFVTSRHSGAIRSNLRFFARQEAAPPAATSAPYPAAGVTPEIPFELPTETEATPDQTYGPPPPPPDTSYGPPVVEEPIAQPEETYGPPAEAGAGAAEGVDNEQPPSAEDEASAAAGASDGSDVVSQNLIQPRFRTLNGRLRAAPARLRAAPSSQRQRRRGNVVEVLRSEPLVVYTLH